MQECDTQGIIGDICRNIPGEDITSCFLWRAVDVETGKDDLLAIYIMIRDEANECRFKKRLIKAVFSKLLDLGDINKL